MPDSNKAFWETVQEEPPDKLYRRDGDCFCPFFLTVFNGKEYHAVFKLFDAAVGNGYHDKETIEKHAGTQS